MKCVSLKNKIAMATFIALGSMYAANTNTMAMVQEDSQHDVKFIEVIIVQSKEVILESHRLFTEFFNRENLDSYRAHLSRFSQIITNIRLTILDPLIEKINAGDNHEALLLARDLMQNLLLNLEKLHTILSTNQQASAIQLGLELKKFTVELTQSSAQLRTNLDRFLHCLARQGVAQEETAELKKLVHELFIQNPLMHKNPSELLEMLRRRLNCRS